MVLSPLSTPIVMLAGTGVCCIRARDPVISFQGVACPFEKRQSVALYVLEEACFCHHPPTVGSFANGGGSPSKWMS